MIEFLRKTKTLALKELIAHSEATVIQSSADEMRRNSEKVSRGNLQWKTSPTEMNGVFVICH